jgi:hypothetical protein
VKRVVLALTTLLLWAMALPAFAQELYPPDPPRQEQVLGETLATTGGDISGWVWVAVGLLAAGALAVYFSRPQAVGRSGRHRT